MRSLLALRRFVLVLSLMLVALATPSTAFSQRLAPGSPGLTPELRERLSRAAGDTLLLPWQRHFMLGLARGDEATALDSIAAGAHAEQPEHASITNDGSWVELMVNARQLHGAIYDPIRDRMVVFGGYDVDGFLENDVWGLSLAGTPAWTPLTPSGTPPSARYLHSAIYDPARDRMVVFGGYDHSYRNDVWALALAGTAAWTALTPSGTPPSARGSHSAIYDPVRDRMVVFGGRFDRNDVWALALAGTPAWTELTPTGTPPSGRSGHSAIYDPVRDRMLVFGGDEGPSYFNDVWVLALAGTPAWTALTPSGTPPSARNMHSAIYDPVRDRVLVFGGYDGSFRNDLWALVLAGAPVWTALTPAGTPPSGRSGHSAIYDPVRDRMLVFGGYGDTGGRNDVRALALAGTPGWTELVPRGRWPIARSGHSAIYDPVRNRMVVFGGDAVVSRLNEVWVLALAGTPAWTELTPGGMPPRYYHSAIYDPMRDRMLVFGGYDRSFYNDVWVLALAGIPAWTELTPSGTPPSARAAHSTIYDPVRDRMVVFGGVDGSRRNDVWALALAGTPAWTALTPTGTPPSARGHHSAIYDPVRDRMVVFGGHDGSGRNDVWALALAGTPTWTELTPTGTSPNGRYGHSAIYDPVRDRMVVFGGYDGTSPSDVWELGLTGVPTWTVLAPSGTPPSGRSGHSAIYDPVRDRMVVFSGAFISDLWSLVWDSPVPALISLVNAEAEPERVTITWFAPDGASVLATVERCTVSDDWRRIGTVTPDGTGRLIVEDTDVTAGTRYGYRLTYSTADGIVTTPEVWVDVPPIALFALEGPRPNPVVNDLVVSFSLPSAEPATLEMFDLVGRCVLAREVGSLGAGTWRLSPSSGLRLPAGIYTLVLRQGERRAIARAVVFR